MRKQVFVFLLLFIIIFLSVFFGLRTHNTKERVISYNNQIRKLRLHIPENYNNSKQYPLIIVLHGLASNPRLTEITTGFSTAADKKNFIVAYPYGEKESGIFSPRSWNSEICCNYASEQSIDDVGFINYLIGILSANFKIDKSKIFVVGFSNGGMLAYLAGTKLTDKISAIAVVGGAVGGRGEEDEQMSFITKSYNPLPVIIFHGRDDRSILFDGGEGSGSLYEFTGAYDSVNFWLENNSCNKYPNEIVKMDKYQRETYSECKNNSRVEFFSYDGGHIWPGGLLDTSGWFSNKQIKATSEILRFFGI